MHVFFKPNFKIVIRRLSFRVITENVAVVEAVAVVLGRSVIGAYVARGSEALVAEGRLVLERRGVIVA